jgi:HK97 family phage prohead protease
LPATTDGHDLFELIQRRDITGTSFAFSIREHGERWDFSQSPPVRTVTDARVSELSFVTWPAYPQTTAEIQQQRGRQAATGNRVEWLMKWSRTQRARG